MDLNGVHIRPNGGLRGLLRVQIIDPELMDSGREVVANVKALKRGIWDMVRLIPALNAGG